MNFLKLASVRARAGTIVLIGRALAWPDPNRKPRVSPESIWLFGSHAGAQERAVI